jgi:hypothetical protein
VSRVFFAGAEWFRPIGPRNEARNILQTNQDFSDASTIIVSLPNAARPRHRITEGKHNGVTCSQSIPASITDS